MFIEGRGKKIAQLRQERNVAALTENISLRTELLNRSKNRSSINISFLRNCSSRAAVHLLILTLVAQSYAAQLPRIRPETAAISTEHLAQMDQVIGDAVSQHQLPGAVVLVARRGQIVWRKT